MICSSYFKYFVECRVTGTLSNSGKSEGAGRMAHPLRKGWLSFNPVKRAGDGFLRALVFLVTESSIHLGIPLLVLGPVFAQIFDVLPEADSQAGSVGRA